MKKLPLFIALSALALILTGCENKPIERKKFTFADYWTPCILNNEGVCESEKPNWIDEFFVKWQNKPTRTLFGKDKEGYVILDGGDRDLNFLPDTQENGLTVLSDCRIAELMFRRSRGTSDYFYHGESSICENKNE